MPQYVVIRFANGQVPADASFGSGEIFLTTQADEHAAAQTVADALNVRSGEHLYSALTSNFVDHVAGRTVTP